MRPFARPRPDAKAPAGPPRGLCRAARPVPAPPQCAGCCWPEGRLERQPTPRSRHRGGDDRWRRPRLDFESHAVGLDRNEVGALLVVAGLGAASEHALISLLALNGLRIPEALGADIEALGLERGHRTLTVAAQGWQDRDRPARSAHGQGSRPGHRRAPGGPHVPGGQRPANGPPRSRPPRAPGRPPRRGRQADRSSYFAPCLHHGRP